VKDCKKSYFSIPIRTGVTNVKIPDDCGVKFGVENLKDFMVDCHLNPHYHGQGVKEWAYRIYHTTKLRPHSIGEVLIGKYPSTYGTVVPPKTPSFTVAGHCDFRCFQPAFPNGITIAGAEIHYHKLGIHVKLRHFADGKELTPIFDREADGTLVSNIPMFNLPRTYVGPGHQLTMECTLNNSASEKTIMQPEFDSWKHNEHCLSLTYYYPFEPNPLLNSRCLSAVKEKALTKAIGIEKLQNYWSSVYPKILLPEKYNGQSLGYYLANNKVFHPDAENILRYSEQWQMCDMLWPPRTHEQGNITVKYPTHSTC